VLFNSPTFLFGFLPVTVALYILLRSLVGPRAVLGLLLAVSIVFYGWWNPAYLPLLGALALVNFALAQAMLARRREGRFDRVSLLLTLGVSFDLIVLGYFKYTDFLIESINGLLSRDFALQHIMLPLGISFFTFQKIAYLVDASRGEVEDHDFLEYCFFVMFFPQLIAGPIVHHREIFSQLKGPGAFAVRPSNLMLGLTIFIIGLFKKVVVADNLAPCADIVFNAAAAGQPLGFFAAWQGALAFSFQLYFDFCGYSEMALGAARLFGVQLPLNFNSPYRALSIADFWRRWHMTLSRFLRDYVYIPLGGSRRGEPRHLLNLLLTMALSGLWHGAAWHYVLWGTVHGIGLVLGSVWRLGWRPLDVWWSRAIARFVTFFSVAAAFALFRAPSVEAAGRIYSGMLNLPQDLANSWGPVASALGWIGFHFDGPAVSPTDIHLTLWVVLGVGFVWFMPNTPQLFARFHPAINYGPAERRRDMPLLSGFLPIGPWLQWVPNAAAAAAVGVLAALAGLSLYHVSEFLYFEF
jgi:D-alanyl-lipoteichoic acid acyltransferase DltB (MBOAT superfamily)